MAGRLGRGQLGRGQLGRNKVPCRTLDTASPSVKRTITFLVLLWTLPGALGLFYYLIVCQFGRGQFGRDNSAAIRFLVQRWTPPARV